jgi:ABC-2 type transport system permease protein
MVEAAPKCSESPGAGFEVVWRPFLVLLGIGGVLFALSLMHFGKTMRQD